MEHKLISGGEQYLPFARSRIKALRATGLQYASQQFEIDGASVKVRVAGEHEYIELSGEKKYWVLINVTTRGFTDHLVKMRSKLFSIPKSKKATPSAASLYHGGSTTILDYSWIGPASFWQSELDNTLGAISGFAPYGNSAAIWLSTVILSHQRGDSNITPPTTSTTVTWTKTTEFDWVHLTGQLSVSKVPTSATPYPSFTSPVVDTTYGSPAYIAQALYRTRIKYKTTDFTHYFDSSSCQKANFGQNWTIDYGRPPLEQTQYLFSQEVTSTVTTGDPQPAPQPPENQNVVLGSGTTVEVFTLRPIVVFFSYGPSEVLPSSGEAFNRKHLGMGVANNVDIERAEWTNLGGVDRRHTDPIFFGGELCYQIALPQSGEVINAVPTSPRKILRSGGGAVDPKGVVPVRPPEIAWDQRQLTERIFPAAPYGLREVGVSTQSKTHIKLDGLLYDRMGALLGERVGVWVEEDLQVVGYSPGAASIVYQRVSQTGVSEEGVLVLTDIKEIAQDPEFLQLLQGRVDGWGLIEGQDRLKHTYDTSSTQVVVEITFKSGQQGLPFSNDV